MILYVEDNEAIAQNVKAYLETEWFLVDRHTHGKTALKNFQTKRYSLVLLDVMLPDSDWFSLCKAMRAMKSVPIIMTTARGTLDDKGIGFDQWADDYLVKPFALEELVMRMRALLKRTEANDIYRFGTIEIFLDENRCLKNGNEIALPLKERQIVSMLVEAWGSTVARATILEEIWWGESLYEHDGKLDVYIANIRKKLNKKFIETVKGVGYRVAK